MELEEIYKQWRWALYNEVDISFIELCIEKPSILKNPYDEVGLSKKYSVEILESYKCKKFDVNKDQIELYDRHLQQKFDKFAVRSSKYFYTIFRRSIFIENCYVDIEQYSRRDLFEKIKSNLIYFHWWDVLTFEDLYQSIIDLHFLKSTQELIERQELNNYFQESFLCSEDLINKIFTDFLPTENSIKSMNDTFRYDVIFDYNWLFYNEFKRSIRILENECRIQFNEKIIGSFFNEDLLFKEIKRVFGNKFNVVSQGSPEWLKPQRFDIFFPDVNIAIEYQGEQHFRPVDFGGKGQTIAEMQFQENLLRDFRKNEKAKLNNCSLFFVNPNYDIKDILYLISLEIKKKTKF